MSARSNRAEVRSPLTALPSFEALATLGNAEREALRDLLLDLWADARLRADKCWRRHKLPMAAIGRRLASTPATRRVPSAPRSAEGEGEQGERT